MARRPVLSPLRHRRAFFIHRLRRRATSVSVSFRTQGGARWYKHPRPAAPPSRPPRLCLLDGLRSQFPSSLRSTAALQRRMGGKPLEKGDARAAALATLRGGVDARHAADLKEWWWPPLRELGLEAKRRLRGGCNGEGSRSGRSRAENANTRQCASLVDPPPTRAPPLGRAPTVPAQSPSSARGARCRGRTPVGERTEWCGCYQTLALDRLSLTLAYTACQPALAPRCSTQAAVPRRGSVMALSSSGTLFTLTGRGISAIHPSLLWEPMQSIATVPPVTLFPNAIVSHYPVRPSAAVRTNPAGAPTREHTVTSGCTDCRATPSVFSPQPCASV